MSKQVFVADTILTASEMNTLQGNDYNQTVSTKTASYTLVAADKGTRIAMNSASATTITVNTSLFSAGDTLFIGPNLGVGVCTITAGTATVSTSGSLALAQYGGGTLYFTSAGVATFFNAVGASYGVATGGASSSITVGGQAYTLLSITTDTNLVVSTAGLFDVLMVGGGAGGGTSGGANPQGAGGAGAVMGANTLLTIHLAAATYAVDIGAGGASATAAQQNGFGTTIGNILSAAGGGTGKDFGSDGGSGGGGAGEGTGGSTLTPLCGNDGGSSSTATNSGGGGGIGSAGTNGSGTTGGAAGNGINIAAWNTTAGTPAQYVGAGGGGGGTVTGGSAGSAGGVAGKTSGVGNAATVYGGGGGATCNAAAGAGKEGIVYIRFKV